ncbi:PEP/pyruvate binding domain protein [Olavius algarvensis associated proteobacterium Delta 3]|nr:PEP/pyruvate binding domain protein [Olavius algarvensis associated proteobacterium Delta 3]CAB5163904.1 PEP/pyruvate binding domain protein [Olavius algarvensis associated proteobacterium Delta 3]
MLRFLKKLINRTEPEATESPEELRIAFRVRYHHFRQLLKANNKTLEVMAEMDQALAGQIPFDMHFIRSRCTEVTTKVWQIVRHINELASGRYALLFERLKHIQKQIGPHVRHLDVAHSGAFVLPLEDVDVRRTGQVGSKLAHIGEIANRIQMATPDGFVVTAAGYQRFMAHNDLQTEIDRCVQATEVAHLDQLFALSSRLQQMIINAGMPPDLSQAITAQCRRLERPGRADLRLAVRSSALGEDILGASFAGQYRSELNVSPDNLLQAYREIIASKYGLSAMSYRLNRGIRDEDVAMCVGCLEMVDAVAGGVMYSRNPVDLSDHRIFINSVWGLPKPVVDGTLDPDLFILSRTPTPKVLDKHIPPKPCKFTCYAEEGVCRLDCNLVESSHASLIDEEAVELAHLAIHLEEYYGIPQDIEWAMDTAGLFVILQCRPLHLVDSEKGLDLAAEEPEFGQSLLRGGITASPGAAAGPVHRIRKEADTLLFSKGAVLVAEQALPRWATLLSRAAAVITEHGSDAGHLASVAREFQVSAVFALPGAMSKLSNGQTITVDADNRLLYEGRMETLLAGRKPKKNVMEVSPVFAALKAAAKHITPLNLLDPDAPEFRQKNCRTFHDITRYCHEKSVQEMFRFGRDHDFPERSSKQLRVQVPMKWWVLNLDDGFRQEVTGKYVDLDDIASTPMLALWHGIVALPWEGPPPVDGKGMMSVLFHATTNTSLLPGLRSRFTERNYFMISKNYCSLSSRLGFHFSSVETMVSDRPSENYITFQFKGGAADSHRKTRRVRLIGDMLEIYGFRVHIKEDVLSARMEGHDRKHMVNRLNILGFLTIHTRQLDMIMANPARVVYYREKLEKEITTLFNP